MGYEGSVCLDIDYGGGGGFVLACDDFGRMFDNSFPACAFFFLGGKKGRAHLSHSLDQDQTKVSQRAETTVTCV